MYTAFFGLNEVPFSIAPNPRYLYMSDRHREALSHLTYGLGGSGNVDGFVLLTGEVGTGKTTISRCLMEQLPDNVQSAFILNPTLSSQELLATICDELKIRYRKTGATLKTLTDKIQEKLVKNHENDINTLLIIDEAQHLQPEVLEQLRLLTNLETNTKKLLQVILIGQPELQQLLKRRDLRQLAQRITARYHLLPLNKKEVELYIKHRLSVAECHRAIFNRGAMTAIHKLSQGIPRLINLLCHRALMNAYNTNDAIVNKKCVLKASSEALGDELYAESWWDNSVVKAGFITASLASVLVLGLWWGKSSISSITNQEDKLSIVQISTSNTQTLKPDLVIAKDNEQQLSVSGSLSDNQTSELPSKPSVQVPQKNTRAIKEPEQQVVKVKEGKIIQPEVVEAQPKIIPDTNYKVNSVDGVSDAFLARFQSAIDETSHEDSAQEKSSKQTYTTPIVPLTDMPSWLQESIPNLDFDMHIYASDGDGWVRVNGKDRYEGDKIADDLVLDKILPQKVILNFQGEQFSLPALSSW